MGKTVKAVIAGLLLALGLSMTVWADEPDYVEFAEEWIESVYVNLPEVTVYGYGLPEDALAVTAKLGSRSLETVENTYFYETGDGINYYILLDVSNSIPEAYFEGIRKELLLFPEILGENDEATLITFGEKVKVIGDFRDEAFADAVVALENTDNRTLLFEAVGVAAELAGSCQGRRVILIFSDGEDVAEGMEQSAEALQHLKEASVAAYALCIMDSARENMNSFGEFARASGAIQILFSSDETEGVLKNTDTIIRSAQKVRLMADTNRVGAPFETLTLTLAFPGLDSTLTKEIYAGRYQPDTEAPVMTQAVLVSENQVELFFSKPVEGYEEPSNYQITGEDNHIIAVRAVTGMGEDKNHVLLTLEEAPEAGSYTVGTVNITDCSEERNPVTGSISFTVKEEEKGGFISSGGEREQRTLLYAPVLAIVVVLVAAAVIIALVSADKKKKDKTSQKEDPVRREEVTAFSGTPKVHVVYKEAQHIPLYMDLHTGTGETKTLSLTLEKSLIVGRSQMCDLYFDDTLLSKQHFALEYSEGILFITDLDSTNGTYVNGVRVIGKRKLEDGDRIQAGSQEITLRRAEGSRE